MLKPLRNAEKSTYIIDRPKLYGRVDEIKYDKVLIMEQDEALGLLIETTCGIKGYRTKICPSYNSLLDYIKEFDPNLILIDYGQDNDGISALENVKKHYKNTQKKAPKIIFSTGIPDKKTILEHGADFYLPKPYDIQTLIGAVEKLLDK